MRADIERRQHPRYFIPSHTQVLASIRADGPSYLGKVTNICEGGFLLAAECSIPAISRVQWQIQYRDMTLQGTGKLDVREETMASVIPDSTQALSPLITLLKSTIYPMGAIVRGEGTAVIKGVLDFETARHLLRRIRSGDGKIDLSHCEDIDSSGLGVLLIAQRENVRLTGCRGKVMDVVEMAGVCRHCPTDSGCRPQRPKENAAHLGGASHPL